MGLVNIAVRDVGEFRQIVTDKIALFIETLALRRRVEDTKIGSRVRASRCRPLPAAVVCGQVTINQLLHEVTFTFAPVNQQIFHQETGGDHAQAVVHPAQRIHLTHRGIHNRVAGFTRFPGIEMRVVTLPFHITRPVDKRLMPTHRRISHQQMAVELTPDQLVQPRKRATVIQRIRMFMQHAMQTLTGRKHAGRQIDRQTAGSVERRKVTLCGIVKNGLSGEMAQPLQRGRFTCREQILIKVFGWIVKSRNRRGFQRRTFTRFRCWHALRQSLL